MARGKTTETAAAGEGETPKRRRRPAAETPAETPADETPTPRRRRATATPADVTPYRGRAHDAAMEVARELLTGTYSRVEIVSATEVLVR